MKGKGNGAHGGHSGRGLGSTSPLAASWGVISQVFETKQRELSGLQSLPKGQLMTSLHMASGQEATNIEPAPEPDGAGLTTEELDPPGKDGSDPDSDVDVKDKSPQLSLDKQFELLMNQRRRWVISYLMETGDTATTGELAEHVAALENGKVAEGEITSKERKAAYVGLYQCHLPKMDDYRVINFRKARGIIELQEPAYELEQYLDYEEAKSWPIAYLGIAVGGGALYSVTTVAGLSELAPPALGATLFGLMVTATLHWWHNRPNWDTHPS